MKKVSIITVVFNNRDFIESAIKSVAEQDYPAIEHIVIDGRSTDGTVEIVERHRDTVSVFVSEPDRGLYDAMNKGLKLATGEILGTLNSDDVYASPDVISSVVSAMEKEHADVCWGDLAYVDRSDLNKVVRLWISSTYASWKFRFGWHPPHPTFFVRKAIYERDGYFNLHFRIASDYELMLRFLEKYHARACYIHKMMIKMRLGGVSNKTFSNIVKANKEVWMAWKTNRLAGGTFAPILKPLSKIFQYFHSL